MYVSPVENLNKVCVHVYFKAAKKLHQVIKYLEDLCPFSQEGGVYQCCQKVFVDICI